MRQVSHGVKPSESRQRSRGALARLSYSRDDAAFAGRQARFPATAHRNRAGIDSATASARANAQASDLVVYLDAKPPQHRVSMRQSRCASYAQRVADSSNDRVETHACLRAFSIATLALRACAAAALRLG